jgi:DNA-binding GntR family transcriptional regulator
VDRAVSLKWDDETGGRLEPLEPLSLATQIADRLVDGIASGRLKPGQRLIEGELAADLGVSRIPVREALRLLESQGLLVARPHRGMRLIAFDEAWARQLYDIRVALERVAWRNAAASFRREPQRLRRLDGIVARMREAVAAGDRAAVNRADIAFHEALCEESNSPLLLTLWRAIRRHVLIVFARETEPTVDLARVLDQHVRARALLARATDRQIARELDDHILGGTSLVAPPTAAARRQAGNQRQSGKGG